MSLFRLLILWLALLVGCLPAEPIVDPLPDEGTEANPEGKVPVVVALRAVGLPASGVRPLVGVQVDVRTTNGYRPYAYGLFEGTTVPPIDMSSQEYYRITASWVEQGALLGVDQQGRVLAPFSNHMGQGVAVGGGFVYSSVVRLSKLTLGLAQLANASVAGWVSYARAPLVRYGAQTSDIVPRVGQGVELLFERVTFGVRITADWLTQGRIEATIDRGPTGVLRPDQRSLPIECTLAGHAERFEWIEPEYADQFTARAVWIRPNGIRVVLDTALFTVKKGQWVEWGLQERK